MLVTLPHIKKKKKKLHMNVYGNRIDTINPFFLAISLPKFEE